MKTYRVITNFRPGIRDNQGVAVQNALVSLGFENVTGVRIGKIYTMSVDDNVDIDLICKKLLVNEVMEYYTIEDLSVDMPKQNWFYRMVEFLKLFVTGGT